MHRGKTETIRSFLFWISFVCVCGTATFSQQVSAKPASTLTEARIEISQGKLISAEEKLWNILSSQTNQPEALTLLGVIRERQKRYPEAEALLQRAIQLDPKSFSARRNLTDALIAQDKTDAAIEQYLVLIKLAPRDNQAKIDLARLYLAKGEFDDALSILNEIPAVHFPATAIPAKAASLLGLGRVAEAAALIPNADPSIAGAAEMAAVFLDGNAPQYALKIIEITLHKSRRPSAQLYFLKGQAQQATGDTSGALSSFREALARDPKSVATLLNMAAIYASYNSHAESLDFLKRAYELEPASPATIRPLIVEAMKAGERNTALRAARVLAEESSLNLDDQYLAAAVMLEGKDFSAASSIFQKYVTQRPHDSKGFLGLGVAELAQQHNAEAKKALEQALQIDPKSADTEYHLALVAGQQGATDEELRHLQRAIELQPQHAKALATLGGQYLQSGELDKARDVLESSVVVDPNNSKSQYDLALVLAKMGKTEEAKAHMDRSRVLKAEEDAGKPPSASTAR